VADENYSVASSLTVKDELTIALTRAAAAARKLDDALAGIRGASPFSRMTQVINNIAEATGRASTAARNLGNVFQRAGVTAARGLSDAADQAERLERALEGSSRVRAPTFAQGAYGGGSGARMSAPSAPIHGGGGAAGAAYRARIGTGPSTTQFRAAAMSGAFGPTPWAANIAAGHGPVGIPPVPPFANRTYTVHGGGRPPGSPPIVPVGGGGSGIGRFAGIVDGYILMQGGAMAQHLGMTIASVVERAFDQAGDLIRQQNLLWASGMSDSDQKLAMRTAQATSLSLPALSIADNLKSLGELRSVLGSMSEAARIFPQFAKFSLIGNSVTGRQTDAYTAIRAAEMLGWTVNRKTGQFDTGRAGQFMNMLTAAEIATHGRVDERQMFNFAQMASLAAKNMSILGLQNMIPIINEMGGMRAGTALQSINQQMIGGVMPQRVLADWQKLGLIDSSKVTATRTGIRVGEGAFKGMSQLGDNPVAWIEDVLVPAMEKAGYGKDRQIGEIMRLFGRSTSQREAGIIATQLVQISKDVRMQQQVRSPDDIISEFMQSDLQMNVANAMGALNNALANIGKDAAPAAIYVLKEVTSIFNDISKFAQRHPIETKWIVMGVSVIAGAMVVAGTFLTAVGAIAIGITALGASVGGIAVGSIVAGLALLPIEIAGVAAAIWGLTKVNWKAVGKAIGDIGASIWNSLLNMFTWVKNQILSILPGINPNAPPVSLPGAPGGRGGNNLKFGGATGGPSDSNSTDSEGTKLDARGHRIVQSVTQGVAHGVAKALNGAAVQMDGMTVGALILHHQVETMKRPVRGKSSFDSRQHPRRVHHAIART
jgi:hypothetical protein